MDTASLEFGAAPEAVNQVQPALRLRVADIVSTPSEGIKLTQCPLETESLGAKANLLLLGAILNFFNICAFVKIGHF